MNRRSLVVTLPVLGAGLVGLGVACQGTSYPNLNPPSSYDAGSQGFTTGTGGGAYDAARDGSVREAGADSVVPKDGATTKDSGSKDVGSGPPPPCAGCTVLVSKDVLTPVSLALDLSNVYWTQGTYTGGVPDLNQGSIRSVPRGSSGGAPVTIVDNGLTGPQILKVLQGLPTVVWSELGPSAGASSVNLQASGSYTAPGTALTAPFGVAIDSGSIYWVSSAGGGIAVQTTLQSGGGSGTTLGTAPGATLVAQGMAVNTTSIYFAAYDTAGGGGLFEMPIAGATPAEIWTGNSKSQPVDVALDMTNVYWTDQGNGAVYSMPLGGGTVTTMASKTSTSSIVSPLRIAVDMNNVYFSDTSGMGLYEVAISTSKLKKLVPSSAGLAIVGVAADDYDGNVYFSSATQILSIAK